MQDVPRSFIKNVALQISTAYKFDNAPYSDDEKEQKIIPFIGRKRDVDKFLEFLNGNAKKGVFLVTGYKGMGKTSFVNYVVSQYKNCESPYKKRNKEGKSRIIPIHLTLTQNSPKEIDILRLLVSSVYDKYNTYRYRSFTAKIRSLSAKTWFYLVKLSLLILLFFSGVVALSKVKACSKCAVVDELFKGKFASSVVEVITPYLLVAFFVYLLVFIYIKFRVFRSEKKDNPYSRIKQLMERCYSSLSEENASQEDFSIPAIKAKFGGSEKRTKRYPVAETKEIEYELQQFLKKVTEKGVRAKNGPIEFIFIFDELDKIDSVVSASYLYDGLENNENKRAEASYEREMRERKQAIINIIASLKNFFTTAPARFIFIAGREMFDASLADIADRQSSISSIFTYIFNIESLLKETELVKGSNRSSLSSAIEIYLKQLLFAEPQAYSKSGCFVAESPKESLYESATKKYLYDPSWEDFELKRGKLYFTLQNFVTFLTYRSNGSPQKLIKTIHEFILVKRDLEEEQLNNLIFKQNHCGSHLYLFFNYENQYRIGFINYLYRPFAIRWGGKLKLYSDNIVVSTPYLFDHLLKFHPFAFSPENLEMIPEVLSTNKAPFLRQHIRMIIDQLAKSHIRETEISLFEYKFYSRTINEITYLSKMFETEAAAFNFTLDESHLVKLHVTNKIRGLRNIYNKFGGNANGDHQLFSVAHLSEVLGDLHFFDQEYDEAITAYSDGIKALGQLNIGEKTDMRDFVSLIKNKLKLGLCFEKTNSYEEALAAYSDCCTDAKKFMVGRLIKGVPFDIKDLKAYYQSTDNDDKEFKEIVFYSSGLSNQLQMILQGYLAKIFIQEKIGFEGISSLKLSIAIGSFLKMFDGFLNAPGRNYLLKANAYMFIGKLWYFKNNQLEFQLENSLNDFKKILPQDFLNQIRNIIKNNQDFIKSEQGNIKPVSALSIYILSLYEVISAKYGPAEPESPEELNSDLVAQINEFENSVSNRTYDSLVKTLVSDVKKFVGKEDSKFRAVHYRYIATLLSNIGDCLLSTYEPQETAYNRFKVHHLFYRLDEKGLDNTYQRKGFDYFLRDVVAGSKLIQIDLTDILRCYYLSGKYFLKYGREISCSFQYNKILHVLKMTLSARHITASKKKKGKAIASDDKGNQAIATDVNTVTAYIEDPLIAAFLKMLQKTIVNPLLQMASETSGGIDTHTIKKARKHDVKRSFALNNISYNQESREPVLLYSYIALKIGRKPENITVTTLISSYNTILTQYSRMIELDFYAKYCEAEIKAFKKANESPEKIENAIAGCLFTRFNMVRILEIYGTNYAIGHRYLAYTHYRIADVLTTYSEEITRETSSVDKILNQLRGYTAYTSIDHVFHYQRAKELYEKTLQLHTGGKEYRKMMADMVYLEDDFNDNAYHFGAALDRYLITNGVVKKMIDKCDEEIRKSKFYSADSFYRDDED